MRNAKVSALIYEFLFNVYHLMGIEGTYSPTLPDEKGELHDAFCHNFTSCWEWSTSVLEEAGVLRALASPYVAISTDREHKSRMRSPFFYPVMTLDECHGMDFSRFETFDNYCHAMFTFSQFIHGDEIYLKHWSPRFENDVARKDDIFLIDGAQRMKFSEDRFQDKVMTRWESMDVRVFRARTVPKVG